MAVFQEFEPGLTVSSVAKKTSLNSWTFLGKSVVTV